MNKFFFHSIGSIVKNSLCMQANHFCLNLSYDESVQLFKESVEIIEVETTSYCNRKCSFCPNKFIDRRSEKWTMPENTWEKIISDLKKLNYDGQFVFCRYSEPLSEERIFERIYQVRKNAPFCQIKIVSNGDYLTSQSLNRLEDVGVDILFIDIYIPDEEMYCPETAKKYIDRFSKRITRNYNLLRSYPELLCKFDSKINLKVTVRNLKSIKKDNIGFSNRGGLIQSASISNRSSPCYSPFKHLVIDWDGSVMLCCHTRSDSPEHKNAVIGKIGDNDMGLVNAYINLADWRKSLCTYGPKKDICKTCNVFEYISNPLNRILSRFLIKTESQPVILARKIFNLFMDR